jgi:uncharacterized membrane protein
VLATDPQDGSVAQPLSSAGADGFWVGPGKLGAWLLAAFATAGFGVAVYLTTVHYAHVPLACSDTGLVNCAKVVSSPFSVVPGTNLPITVPGMGFFLVSFGLAWAQLRRPYRYSLRQAHFAWACLGLLTVFYLVFVELVELHNICLWCTSVHALIVLTLITTAWRLQPPADDTP